MNSYKLLIKKLDEFIRKYYVNQLLRGLIYATGSILAIYLLVSLLEYIFILPPIGRQFLFYGFLAFSVGALGYWIGIPFVHLFHLGKVISHEQAARIIGRHFTHIEDRLLNILQLRAQFDHATNTSLIEASIDQKIGRLKPVPFTSAINLGQNTRYLKYILIPMGVIAFILLAAPNILEESNQRLIDNSRNFANEAPFEFIVTNQDMNVPQYEDFTLELEVRGDKLPEKVVAIANDYNYTLNREGPNRFTYRFKKVQDDIRFHFQAGRYNSEDYMISVIPKPMILNFDIMLDYPAYTGKRDEQLKNIGDFSIPAGTEITWQFNTEHTQNVEVSIADSTYPAMRTSENAFSFNRMLLDDQAYKIYVSNERINHADSIGYNIAVTPDKYPVISVEQFQDSMNTKFLYFLGKASDDYGLRNLAFRYRHQKHKEDKSASFESLPVKKANGAQDISFNYSWDLTPLNIEPGDVVEYYFMVWDNDGIHGSKYSKTPTMTFQMPTYEEYKKMTRQQNEKLKDDMEKSVDEARKLKEDIKALQEKLIQKKELSWEDKKAIEELLKKQEQLKKQMENIQKDFDKNINQQSEYSEHDQRIMEKQQKLQEMFDEIMSDEMKKLMEEMEKLLDEMNQEQALEELEEFEMSNDQMEKEMDRMLELFKQLEFEQKLNETLQGLEELAEKQEELQKESENPDSDAEDLAEKQEELNEEFEDVQEQMDELDQMNRELENKQDFKNDKEQQEDIEQDMKQSQEELKQNQKQDASEKQKDAAKKMKEMAESMNSMMSAMQMQQMMLDMEAIQQLLENLITLSFDQEELMERIQPLSVNSAQYTKLIQEQYKIKDDAKMVEDSLYALSKRVFQISSFVNKQITDINKNMDESIELLAERQKSQAVSKQQYVMTGMNNLALMLDEILQSMQQQMASMMSGQQMCQMPMSGQQMQKLSEQQQELNKQMQKLKEEMENGGGKKSGKKQGQMSKELAKLAAQQAAIRRTLEELNKQMDKDGQNSMGDLEKLAEEMEKTEEDIVNKQLTNEMLERQKEILTRLLEAADAEREREKSPERESRTADNISKELPPSIEEYLKKRKAEVDLYKTVPPRLKPFYKNIVQDYFESISIE